MPPATAYENSDRPAMQPLRPYLAGDVVSRPRLHALLEQGASLTLVVAPAGYGKTTLIADWLEQYRLPYTWVTFDTEVNDLHQFLTVVLTAVVASLRPNTNDALQALLAAHTLPPLDLIAEILYQELSALEQEFFLVLDDYQAVSAPAAHALLTALLRLPATALRLILATRYDPPLPLVRLRASGRLTEVRSRELSFTPAEAQQLLADSRAAPLTAQEIADLVRSTEGWATSLRLAQLYLRQEQGFATLVHAIDVGARQARDFLAEEVFAGLPLAIQEFLMRTSVLEHLSAPACAVLTDTRDTATGDTATGDTATGDTATAQAHLRWLVTNGVFTAPIDDAQEHFRCHALLRQFAAQQLQNRYGADAVAGLHRRASRWFAAAGQPEEAIRHALAAGDVRDAVNVLAHVRHDLMQTAQWLELNQLLHLFSAQQLEREPELLLVQAWSARSQHKLALQHASLQRASDLLDSRDDEPTAGGVAARTTSLRGEIELLWGHLCYWRADMAGLVAHTRRSLALLPRSAAFARGYAILYCVTGCHATGEQAAAYALLDRYAEELQPEDDSGQMQWLTCRVVLYALEGELSLLAATAEAMLELSVGQRWTEPVGVAHCFRVDVHYWRNELAAIEPLALAVLGHRYQLAPRYVVQTASILALAYQAQGRAMDANAVATAELLFIETNGLTEMRPYLHALQADLALRQGNVDAAAALLRETAQTPLVPTQFPYTPHLVLLRLYLQQATAASLDAAAELLERVERFWTAVGHAQVLLELTVHKALYWQARGNPAAALASLAQAAQLAERHGNIRVLADRGTQVDGLLAKLQAAGVAPLLVAAARAVIAGETPQAAPATQPSETMTAALTGDRTSALASDLASDITVLLTLREQEVLQLLGQHLTNQEIAAKLYISSETVKRHSISIFRKLDVKNRRAAALYARELGGGWGWAQEVRVP